jgi:dephospho-CoA kinase
MTTDRPPAGAERAGSPPRPLVIGLTGPIGCGKSTVARLLADVGATVIDADVLARRATEPGSPALPAIRVRFGDAVFDAAGELDRAALARRVFADPAALAELEQIVHPQVRRLIEAELAAATAEAAPIVAIEAIKLVEGGLAERCDEVWLIECAPAAQRARLAARGATPEDAEQRLSAQGADLVDRLVARLGDQPYRRLSTDGSLEDSHGRVEDALADALTDRR